MKKRTLFHNLSIFFLSVLILLGYLFLFLFPSLVNINRCRREINDIRLKIDDHARTQQMMVFPDRREKKVLRQTRQKFRRFIPKVENSQRMNSLLQQVCHYVRSSAKARGIQRLFVENCDPVSVSFSSEPDLTDIEKQMLSRFREIAKKEGTLQSSHPGTMVFYGSLYPQMKSEKIILGFSGGIEQTTSLIYDLSRSDLPLQTENIQISAGIDTPFFLVSMRFFFRDKKKEAVSSAPAGENRSPVPKFPDYSGSEDDFIDFNSPLLLVPVYYSPVFKQQNRKLPEYSGQKIFILNRR